jgi:ribosome-binding protein aMBF1 (putative translation factor)
MAATPKPKRQEQKKIASKERKLNKEVISKQPGVRKAREMGSAKLAKKLGAKKSFVKSIKSMY